MNRYETVNDARTVLINNGLLEAVDIERSDEIAKYMYMHDCEVEDACNQLNAWKSNA